MNNKSNNNNKTLREAIRKEIKQALKEGVALKIGSSTVQGILLAKSLKEAPGKYYMEELDDINDFFAGKDTVAADRTNPNDEEGRWVNNKEYKYVTLLLR